jgi:type I restriction enzyme M protein
MSDESPTISIPLRRMTQAELDSFLEKAADILRGNVDHSEFRGYVFALLFFRRISDIFEESVRNLAKKVGDELANDPAMQKKSLPFVVPPDCMWEAVTVGTTEKKVSSLQLGQSLNDAMLASSALMRQNSMVFSPARSISTKPTSCRATSWST